MGQCKASVFVDDGTGYCWAVAQTPNEAKARFEEAVLHDELFVEFDLADDPPHWGGRPISLITKRVVAIGPPQQHTCVADDDDAGGV